MVTPAEPSRIAVCLRRGVGTAPVRNRLRRITREASEPFVSSLVSGCHIAFLPNRAFADLAPSERMEAVGTLLKRSRLLRESEAAS